jgi:hypothetical protein
VTTSRKRLREGEPFDLNDAGGELIVMAQSAMEKLESQHCSLLRGRLFRLETAAKQLEITQSAFRAAPVRPSRSFARALGSAENARFMTGRMRSVAARVVRHRPRGAIVWLL